MNDHPAVASNRGQLGQVTIDDHDYAVDIAPEAGQFEIRTPDGVALLAYHVRGSAMSLIHTEVPAALRRHGLAATLARHALAYARDHALVVRPYCPFVAAYIAKHPEYQPLVDPAFQAPASQP